MTELESPDARAARTASTTDLGDLPTLNDAVIGEMTMPGSRAEVAPGSPFVPDADVSLTDQARASLKAGDSKTAIRLLRQVLAVDPGDADASALLATAYNREHDYRAALAAANAGLGVSLDNVPLLDAKAYALNRLKDFRGALAAADRAAALRPRDALAQFNRAIALAGLGDRVGALEALKAAASLSPTFVPYLEAARTTRGADLKFLLEDDYDLAGQTPLSRRVGWWILGVVAAVGCALATLIVLRSEVGTDGMGVVHEGMDTELDRRVVIRRMREEVCADERVRRGFVSEARAAAQLRHPHIVELLEIVEAEGEVYLVFEHVGGRTLEQRIAEGRLPFAEARALFVQAASALDYAHAHGILHRGLRPSNIMVDEDGVACLMDFGVTVAGAPPYLAPEQEQGKARAESDVYALAICLYEALTGERPFDGIDAGLSMNKLNKAYAPASKVAKGLPAYIDIFFARAFEPDPTKRHSTGGALMSELEGLK
ncbi:MAG: serine/threonine-protein kinase [Elusimicrobia bacterium]|nr:serine/threonine-protein kinase [Elusimicrobiota bacterium]